MDLETNTAITNTKITAGTYCRQQNYKNRSILKVHIYLVNQQTFFQYRHLCPKRLYRCKLSCGTGNDTGGGGESNITKGGDARRLA